VTTIDPLGLETWDTKKAIIEPHIRWSKTRKRGDPVELFEKDYSFHFDTELETEMAFIPGDSCPEGIPSVSVRLKVKRPQDEEYQTKWNNDLKEILLGPPGYDGHPEWGPSWKNSDWRYPNMSSIFSSTYRGGPKGAYGGNYDDYGVFRMCPSPPYYYFSEVWTSTWYPIPSKETDRFNTVNETTTEWVTGMLCCCAKGTINVQLMYADRGFQKGGQKGAKTMLEGNASVSRGEVARPLCGRAFPRSESAGHLAGATAQLTHYVGSIF
jgi:hypothetical protein